ncbi:LAMI_0B04500g1_1 [Lachancea mirantina]|uniref:LAMI_0B04500g1_1 n=1 Tax=Lachancea mirantina TaxID=1230905 RepID=A0A1G4IVD9_9SACH|nr:LAMI_0B04500g1_1 [Lachancea mirantina]
MNSDYADLDARQRRFSLRKKWALAGLALFLAAATYAVSSVVLAHHAPTATPEPLWCNSVRKTDALPVKDVRKLLANSTLWDETLAKLANAVRVPTEIYDHTPDPSSSPDDAIWEPFQKLHDQLESDFPAVWSKLQVETVNEYGLVITWEGSREDLKPVMFAAHMDVVPVERKTWSHWQHEPFSGDITHDPELGDLLWGRGSFDDKNMLIGILQALEYLLTHEPDYTPRHGVVVAIGFDEEVGGYRGAQKIAKLLHERYGQHGILSIIDEGVVGVKEIEGVLVAAPGTGEKGRYDMQFELNTPGGHSSVPPDHTSIGIAADLISTIEREKFPAMFTSKNPMSQYYRCIADYSTTMDKSLKRDFLHSMTDPAANNRVINFLIESGGHKTEYLFRSTHAFDIIHGGIKANALPETVSFLVDSRIAVETSVQDIQKSFLDSTLEIARKYDLGVTFEGEELIPATANGNFRLTTEGKPLEAAPVAPQNDIWDIFSGTIKSFYEDVVFPTKFNESRELIVAPSIMTANTDTAHYWNLTRNIYRYQPGFAMEDTLSTIHSVNEHINAETVMHVVAFVYGYIRTVDSA